MSETVNMNRRVGLLVSRGGILDREDLWAFLHHIIAEAQVARDVVSTGADGGLVVRSECGRAYPFASAWEIPEDDLPCECGDPTCFVIAWIGEPVKEDA